MRDVRRYCPLCDWEYMEPQPQVLQVDARSSFDETIRAAVDRHRSEVEATLRDHMLSRHTTPAMLADVSR